MAEKDLEKCNDGKKPVIKKTEVEVAKADDVEKAEAKSKGQGDERDTAGKVKEDGEKRADVVEKATEPTVTEEALLKAIQSLEEFSKAQRDVEEEEEEEEEEKEEPEEEKKAFEDFEDNETLEKAIEVSPFLEALVNETSLALEAVGKDVNGLRKSMSEFDGKYIESLKSLTEIVKGLHTEIKEFFKSTGDRLTVIEQTPAGARKSIMKSVDVKEIKKSFAGGGSEGTDLRTLPKRVIADALTKAVMDGKIRDTVLMAFEGEHNTAFSPEQEEIVKAYLPKE
jgi:hypothetical protein